MSFGARFGLLLTTLGDNCCYRIGLGLVCCCLRPSGDLQHDFGRILESSGVLFGSLGESFGNHLAYV